MKKSSLVMFTAAAAIAVATTFAGCGGGNPQKKGINAGKELCNCIKKTNDADDCHEKIGKKYAKFIDDSKFGEGIFIGYEQAGCK